MRCHSSKDAKYGFISWVTQLVVHEDTGERRRQVAAFAIWTFTDHFAWGLLTANPYAIRALEKATRRGAKPARNREESQEVRKHCAYSTWAT